MEVTLVKWEKWSVRYPASSGNIVRRKRTIVPTAATIAGESDEGRNQNTLG